MKTGKCLLACIFLFFLSASSQTNPMWFQTIGIFRNYMPINTQETIAFDQKIRNSGIAAWGEWVRTGEENKVYQNVLYYKALGNIYVAHVPFKTIGKGELNYYSLENVGAQKLDGNFIIGGDRIAASTSSPIFAEALQKFAKIMIDGKVDGIFFDDLNLDFEFSFDRHSLDKFRLFLKNQYTNGQLKQLFDINDIDQFNYKEWIIAHGQYNNWTNLPLNGLKEQLWLFRMNQDRILFKQICEYAKKYAKEAYGYDITVSGNIFCGPTSEHDIYLDLVDYTVGEFHMFNKKSLQILSSGNYNLGQFATDYVSIANKIRKSIKDWPVLSLNELAGFEVLDYARQTTCLMKLMIADAYASQGMVLLQEGIDVIKNTGLSFGDVNYNQDIVANYSKFIYDHNYLFTNLHSKNNCALIYSMSSLNKKSDWENWSAPSGSFYGTAEFLLDNNIPFDVIFAPDTRFCNLPDISLEILMQYKNIILPNTICLNENQVNVFLDFANQGGTILAFGDIGTKNEDGNYASRPELSSLQNGNGVINLGFGKFVYFKEQRSFGYEFGLFYYKDPTGTQNEFLNYVEPYIVQPIQLDNADKVRCFLYEKVDTEIMHLVNYDYNVNTDNLIIKNNLNVRVRVDTTKSWEAIHLSPDFSGQDVLATALINEDLTFAIPQLEAYSIIVIQQNQSSPTISKYSPNTDTTIVAGSSLHFSVDATDIDNNILYYKWYVNGKMDTLCADNTFFYNTKIDDSGIDTIAVEVSDGRNKAFKQWFLQVRDYIRPKILFDESHGNGNTISIERAKKLNPDHPDWIYYGIVKNKMELNFTFDMNSNLPLTNSKLSEYHALVIATPATSFSSNEINDIRSFVSKGGGLFLILDCGINSNLSQLLSYFGVFQLDGVLFDQTNGGNLSATDFFNYDDLKTVPNFQMNWGGSLRITAPSIAVMQSSNLCWRDINWNGQKDSNEPNGPFVIMCVAEYGKGKVCCISDNSFHDDYVKWEASQNDDLFINIITWMTNQVNQIQTTVQQNKDDFTYLTLDQNYPNPCNESTTISYQITEPGLILIQIYNIWGQKVRTLANCHHQKGSHKISWDGNDDFGCKVGSGIYMYQLKGNNSILTKKLLLLK